MPSSSSDNRIVFNRTRVGEIISLAWPTMLEELVDTAVQYADIAMVGTLGTAATAAVGCTATINWLVGSSIAALGTGFLSYISKALGAKDLERARRASAQAVFAALTAGIVFTILTLSLSGRVPVWMNADENIRPLAARYFFILYSATLFRAFRIILGAVLRSSGDSRTPMRVGLWVNLSNVVLNFLLIYPNRSAAVFGMSLRLFGAGLGVEGAALASAVSVAGGGLAIAVLLFRHRTVSPAGCSLLPDGAVLKPCLKVALPNMLQRFCTSLGYVIFAGMINSLGEVSTAAHTIANTVESAFYIPGYGMQAAAATLTGNCIGAGDRKRLSEISGAIVVLEVSMMVVSGGLLFIFAPQMVGLFAADAAVIALGGLVLRMVALSEPFYGISIVTEGMLMGAGETFMPFVFNLVCMWGVRIIGTWVCISHFGFGLASAWACMIADNLLLLVFLRFYWKRGSWKERNFTAKS